MAKRTNPKRVAGAIRMYECGLTVPVVARKTGVAESVIYRGLYAAGIKPLDLMRRGIRGKGNRKFTDTAEAEIGVLYLDGFSLTILGECYGVNAVTIRNILVRRGIDRRRRGNDRIGPPKLRFGRRMGSAHHNWRGGRMVGTSGYVLVLMDRTDPLYEPMGLSTGYIQEHRLIMARHLGRPLGSNESVHHINCDRQDNRIENLQLHHRKHGKGQALQCADCGSRNIKPVTFA